MPTRRQFLEGLGTIGSASLVYEAMAGLGLIAVPSPQPAFDLRGSSHAPGVRVAVLGAGLAGLAIAYELRKLGYDCQVLEARPRPGGRVYTVRRGAVSEEDGPTQVCAFDEGLYFNPGAMRIPHHHNTTLQYCRELQVPVEPFCINCDSAFLFQENSPRLARQRIRIRDARADVGGYIAELLTKAISEESLNAPLTSMDRENLLQYLKQLGALSDKAEYTRSGERGYDVPPGAADQEGQRAAPFGLSDLLGSKVALYLNAEYDYQPTMLQVAGGMDRLPAAFAAHLKDAILYRAAVREIRQNERGVTIVYGDRGGKLRTLDADYCACTLPLPVLAELKADFSSAFKWAVGEVKYAAAGKMGLQFRRRFWEEDEGIYGGITRTDQEIAQIVYPSHGFHSRKGIVLGYYIMGGDNGRKMGDRTPAERQAAALEQGARIHRQYTTEFENGFSVAWHRMRWSKGSWATYSDNLRNDAYPLLIEPQGRVYLAGDHVSYVNAWMQGALESGRHVAKQIHLRALQEVRPEARAR
jgi:monoamine oxidase